MKSVLISIHPRHCENIASGKKTVEVRKTIPKIPTPFKCYIYETKDKRFEDIAVCWNDETPDFIHATGKVVGEFVCDEIREYKFPYSLENCGGISVEELKATCLSADEFCKYGTGKTLYGWHISDLKIYDKPKELSEFSKPECEKDGDTCFHCRYSINVGYYECPEWGCDRSIIRPPQSYMFVEELK